MQVGAQRSDMSKIEMHMKLHCAMGKHFHPVCGKNLIGFSKVYSLHAYFTYVNSVSDSLVSVTIFRRPHCY